LTLAPLRAALARPPLRALTAALLAAALGASAAHAAAPRTAAGTGADERWNLAELYRTPADWSAELDRVAAEAPSFAACRGHLADDAATLRRCLDLQAAVTLRVYRLFAYATQRLD
jgi:oligoendopeptidase F